MSFLKIPFALSLTGRGCQRTLWSADTTLLGFGGILLIETAKKPPLIIAPKLSFRIIPGLETWGVLVLQSHSSCGAAELGLESLSRVCTEGSGKPGLASDCHPGSIRPLSESLLFTSVPEKSPNKAEWICQALMYVHTTRTLAGLFLRMGHHLGELRKQLIRAPGENPFLPGHCCAME